LLLALCHAGSVGAEWAFSRERLYFGGGVGSSRIPEQGEPVSTVQLLAGYRLETPHRLDPSRFRSAVELGYLDTGDSSYDGGWATPVLSMRIDPHLDLLLRAGADFGVHPSLLGGLGISYTIERNMAVRLEYVKRSQTSTLQLNLVYAPWFFDW
jgi:hypothetical protein